MASHIFLPDRDKYRIEVNGIPSTAQVIAAQRQEIFYRNVWEQDFQYWHDVYLEEAESSKGGNLTIDEKQEAFEKALEQATGSGGCQSNRAGTSWFFFTIMTTVGYGNQAPSTTGGRVLVATFGFFSILCFGAILANSGGILAVLYEDVVHRCNLKRLGKPFWASMFWGFITAVWTLFLGYYSHYWWSTRLPEDDVPSPQDSRWYVPRC